MSLLFLYVSVSCSQFHWRCILWLFCFIIFFFPTNFRFYVCFVWNRMSANTYDQYIFKCDAVFLCRLHVQATTRWNIPNFVNGNGNNNKDQQNQRIILQKIIFPHHFWWEAFEVFFSFLYSVASSLFSFEEIFGNRLSHRIY